MSTKEAYNERRQREDNCSSCGKYIGFIKPRFCIKCKLKQDKNNAKRVYVRKNKKLIYKLKAYTTPKDP